jgi:hypothetical protein
MQAQKVSDTAATAIQLSLRIRHPDIDPDGISAALGLEPEHCFRAGEPRAANRDERRSGRHVQTYWLAPVSAASWHDPIEPTFLAAIAANRHVTVSAEKLQATARNLRSQNIDAALGFFLRRLRAHRSFLQRIQSEGGDVTVLMLMQRESAPDFALPPPLMRSLVELGIGVEFKFDS